MLYAEVALPLPLSTTFTYSIPQALSGQVRPGHRVIVPFGLRKFYTGIVLSILPKAPQTDFEIKEIAMALDDEPIVRYPQIKFWQWLSDYYLCTLGDVFRAAIPAGLKVESETFLEINPDYDADSIANEGLGERELTLLGLLRTKGKMSVGDIEKASGMKRVSQLASQMLDSGHIIISEKLVERYRTRKVPYVRLADTTPDGIASAFAAVKGAKKQESLLLALLQLSGAGRPGATVAEVTRDQLLEKSGVSGAILLATAKKEVVEIYHKEVGRFRYTGKASGTLPTLTTAQSTALREIGHCWETHNVALLHGVTSSGKTEIYQHLIAQVLGQGEQCLLLVPEIALTTQLTQRMQKVFGDKVVIYHSKFSDSERVEIWRRMLRSNEPCVVIGARSAVFLPFAQLKLVIVDEEHEPSYKQFAPAPRYHGRDAAIVLASMHGAKTLLGSATPAIETYWKAREGKFGLVELLTRYNDAALPEIETVDMTRAHKSHSVSGSLADVTAEAADKALAEGHQVIFFQNRRGYAPLVRCKMCAWVPRCERCDVSLTYHKRLGQMVCHYCGSSYAVPHICPQCKEPAIEVVGYGTERIEDEVQKRFPSARISRMDLDTTRNKDGYERIITEFSQGKSDILIGTQMVTKGLDFGGVSVVGILNADSLIHYPDFRSSERAFNMMSQVAGRAGRRGDVAGRVIIQSYDPEDPVIKHICAHDYEAHYRSVIEERQKYLYPPFSRVINIYLRHRDPAAVATQAAAYAEVLRQGLGKRVYGPEEPPVARIQLMYIRRIMLKVEPNASMPKIKSYLREVFEAMHNRQTMKGIQIHYDVDPA